MGASECDACDEMETMTRAMYFEATPLNFHDMVAIGTIIKERVHIGYRNADTICDVVHSKGQFSALEKIKNNEMDDKKALQIAKDAAYCVLRNDCSHAAVRGVLDYYACKGRWGIPPPYWAKNYKLVAQVGDHCYLMRDRA